MTTATFMPAHGEHTAPQFDMTKPRALRRYFDELEFHFDCAQVTDHQECKYHAQHFLNFDNVELWEAIPQYSDATISYGEFKQAIFHLYPGSEDARRWSHVDLTHLIKNSAHSGVHSLSDLGKYFRQFH